MICVLALLTVTTVSAQNNGTARKKVAVVLSGGGAKGVAHIGVLRVIERAGLPIDIVTGTSMGALIGGLYSIGYDANTLDSLVMAQDWNMLLSDKVDTRTQSLAEREKQNTYILSRPLNLNGKIKNVSGGLIAGTNLSQLFSRLTMGYHDSISFATLPIPFACVATDIVTNTEHDYYGGYLPTAMRASMAIPGVFTPIRKDSMVLVDGGMRNNYPADIAKNMGADIIIGVSVQSDDKTAAELVTGPDILLQIVDINCKNKYEENWAMTDIPIKVDVKGYSSASFTRVAIDTLIRRGERAAMQQWDKLIMLKRSLGLDDDYKPTRAKKSVPTEQGMVVKIDTVEFERIEPEDAKYIITKFGMNHGDSVYVDDIQQAVNVLGANMLYANAGYSLMRRSEGSTLKFYATDKRTSRVRLGVRFDTEETVALQANISHQLTTSVPINLEFTGRLGKRMMARLDADANPLHYSKIGFTYIFRHDDINIYDGGKRDYNFTYNQHSLRFKVFTLNFRNLSMGVGVNGDFYNFHDVLSGNSSESGEVENMHLYSYTFSLNYDSEDKWFFTTRGARFNAEYGYYTDNFISWKDNPGINVIKALWRMSFAMNSRFVIQPMLYGRLVTGSDMPFIMRNAIGGQVASIYLEHQLPFAGIGHIEFIDDMFFAGQLRMQQRIMDNNYIMARLSLGQHSDKLEDLFSHGPMTGCEIAYYYNSMFGPLGASLGYSSRTDRPYFYINLGFQF